LVDHIVAASNKGFSDLPSSRVPVSASPRYSEVGVKKPVSERKKRSSFKLEVTISTDVLSGTGSLRFVHVPSLLCVYT